MAINPVDLSGPGYRYGMLSSLGDTFSKVMEDRQQRQAQDDIARLTVEAARGAPVAPQAAPGLADMQPSYNAAGKAPSFVAASGGKPSADLASLFAASEQKYGLPDGVLTRMASLESGFNPKAQNPSSSAGGLFQFTNGTAKQYGLADKTDPVASTDAAARLAANNKTVLTRALGREPTPGELYLAHQQGAGGALKLLRNPDARAVDVLGPDAVMLNGGDATMTAGQFAQKWTSRVDAGGPQTTGSVPSAAPAPAQSAMPAQIQAALASSNKFVRQWGLEQAQAYLKPTQYGFQTVGDQLYRTNPRTGAVEAIPGVTKPQTSTVGPGQVLVDQSTGREIYRAPIADKDRYEPIKSSKSGTVTGIYDKVEGRLLSPEEAQRRGVTPAQAGAADNFDDEHKLRQEFDGLTKDYREIDGAYNRIGASAKDPSAAGDLAMIFNYMKMLDPGSVVREGEFATAQNAAGVDQRIAAQYNRLLNGERLTEATRADFIDRANRLYAAETNRFNQRADQFRDVAKGYGFDPDKIVKRRELPTTRSDAAGAAPLAVGASTTINGLFIKRTK